MYSHQDNKKLMSLNPQIANFIQSKNSKTKTDLRQLNEILRGKSALKSKLSFKKTASSIQTKNSFQKRETSHSRMDRRYTSKSSKPSDEGSSAELEKQTTWLESFQAEMEGGKPNQKEDDEDFDQEEENDDDEIDNNLAEEEFGDEDYDAFNPNDDQFGKTNNEDQVAFTMIPSITRRASTMSTSETRKARKKSLSVVEKELNIFRRMTQENFQNEIPRNILKDLITVALPSVEKAAELYRAQVGDKNEFTQLALKRLSFLREKEAKLTE